MPPHGCVQYDDGADLQLFISNMVPIYLGRNCTAVDVDISVAVNSTSTMAVPHAVVTVIDADHANPVEAWEARGSPMVLSREDTAGKIMTLSRSVALSVSLNLESITIAALKEASVPTKTVVNVTHGQGALGLRLTLPPTSVVHVAFGEW